MIFVDFIVAVVLVLVTTVLAWLVWRSSEVIGERNRLRKETGKYYDFEIAQELEKREREQQTTGVKLEKVTTASKRKSKTKTAKTEL